MELQREIAIVEQDGDTVRIIGKGPKGEIEVVAWLLRETNRITLAKARIEGPGPNRLGLAELRAFAHQFAVQGGVAEIVVYGAERTTGARPGHVPHPFIYRTK